MTAVAVSESVLSPPQRTPFAATTAALSRLASRGWLPLCTLAALCGALWCNRLVALQTTPAALLRTPDFAAIVYGYQHSSGPFDSDWWTGSWIHHEQGAYRPLTSIFHYAECAVGFRWGFFWVTLIGLALYVGCCVAAGVLSRELFRGAWLPAVASACLASLAPRFIPKLYDDSLAWFPGHPEYLWTGALLLGCACFTRWGRTGSRGALAGSVALCVAACLTKEAAYIAPLMYAVCGVLARVTAKGASDRPRSLLAIGGVVTGLLAGIAGLYIYRRAVVPHPITPKVDAHLWAKHLCYMYNAWYAFALSEPGYCLLAFGLFVCVGGALVWGGRTNANFSLRRRALPVFVALLAAFGVSWAVAGIDPVVALLYLTEQPARLYEFGLLVFFLYTLYLVASYARQTPQLLAAWLLVNLSYLPVLSFMGPHYAIAGWMFRAVYSVALAVVLWDRAGRPLLSRLRHWSAHVNNSKRNYKNV